MKKIVYVGLKDQKGDNVAGTGLVWTRGQIHEVEDDAKAIKLLAHKLIWQDADGKYELVPGPKVVPPEPRVNIIQSGDVSPYWEPVVIPIAAEDFTRLQKKELVAVFMTNEDADAYADWKLERDTRPDDTTPRNTGPTPDLSKMDKRSREYREAVAKQGLEKKVA